MDDLNVSGFSAGPGGAKPAAAALVRADWRAVSRKLSEFRDWRDPEAMSRLAAQCRAYEAYVAGLGDLGALFLAAVAGFHRSPGDPGAGLDAVKERLRHLLAAQQLLGLVCGLLAVAENVHLDRQPVAGADRPSG